jgi:hypothetical protein
VVELPSFDPHPTAIAVASRIIELRSYRRAPARSGRAESDRAGWIEVDALRPAEARPHAHRTGVHLQVTTRRARQSR